jgi:predicted Fe-Mo cluster-binding NifX family protein
MFSLMMQELIDTLHTEQCSLVILHEGNINTYEGHGVRRLYNIINEAPELFLEAKIAVKAVGRSAARMMVEGGVSEVYADIISQQAYDLLTGAGITVSYEKKVDHPTFLRIWQKLGELEMAEQL